MNRREFIFGSGAFALCPTIGFGNPCDGYSDELRDLIEFSRKCKIVDLKYGWVNFNPRPYQIEYFKNILESKTLVCRKCRQCGATTMNLIYAHWMAERHPEKKVVVVFSKLMMAKEAEARFNSMFPTNPSKWYENTPNVKFISYGSFLSSCNEIYNQNKDCGKYPLYTNAYLNSNTILVFEEYAFHGFICVHLGDVKSIWVSTPNMPNDVMWGNGNTTSTMTRMKITWRDVPGWNNDWRNSQVSILGNDRFNQEFEV